MAFFRSRHRDSSPDISKFTESFSGDKIDFSKLSKNELEYFLHFGSYKKTFPMSLFIDYLVEIKWDFNQLLMDMTLPLNLFCSYGNLEVVKKMIAAGADVHAKDSSQVSALCEACKSGNLELVEYILSFGMDINECDAYGESPLFYAIYKTDYDIFIYLLEKGADFKARDEWGSTLLHKAVGAHSFKMVDKLIEIGLDIEVETNNGGSVLDRARLSNKGEMFKRLIQLGAPIAKYCQSPDFNFKTVLRIGDLDLARIFFENGARYERENGESILHELNGGAEFDYRDCESCYEAAYYPETPIELVEYIISLGLDINKKHPENGKTPLMNSCLIGTLEQVKLLLKHGADCSLTDDEGITALHYASHGGNADIVAYLIKNCKMDPNIRESNGQTPLHMFQENNNTPSTLKALIANGADINAQDNQQRTPLHVSTMREYHEYVDYLLQHGAKKDILDKHSKLPIDYCYRNTEVEQVYAKHSTKRLNFIEYICSCFK